MDFAPEDLALATVPGADFDPKERSFDVEELRPQPIIRLVFFVTNRGLYRTILIRKLLFMDNLAVLLICQLIYRF